MNIKVGSKVKMTNYRLHKCFRGAKGEVVAIVRNYEREYCVIQLKNDWTWVDESDLEILE